MKREAGGNPALPPQR